MYESQHSVVSDPDLSNVNIKELVLNEAKALSKNECTFPLEAFPNQIKCFIEEAHQKLNFPTDYLGSSILFAASIAIGSTHRIEIKKGFTESGVVWIALVGRPGVNKSHPLKFAIQPILQKDAANHRQYQADYKQYEELEALSDKQRKDLGYDYLPTPPVLKKHLIQDFTPEALAKLHQQNPRGIGIYADELMGWINNFNRYSKGNDQETALQLWSGHPLSIDRKNSGNVFIPQPFVPVIGTIQPSVLAELGKGQSNGFLDRILFAAPAHLKKQAWSDEEINEDHISNYHSIIHELLQLQCDQNGEEVSSHILRLEPSARVLLFDWQHTNTKLVNNAETDMISGYYSKLDIYVPRLIMIMHLLANAERKQASGSGRMIERWAVEAGIQLGEYYRKQAEQIFDNLMHTSAIEKLPFNLRLLYETLPQLFKRKEVLRHVDEANISHRTLDRMLSNRELFIKSRNGEYERLF